MEQFQCLQRFAVTEGVKGFPANILLPFKRLFSCTGTAYHLWLNMRLVRTFYVFEILPLCDSLDPWMRKY
jgi:hypothetical protein